MNDQDPFGQNAVPSLTVNFVQTDKTKLIVLERISDNPEPAYCVHGRTRCFGCDEWLYLGPQTIDFVSYGHATPYCQQCAAPRIRPDHLAGHIDDTQGHQ